MLSCRGLAGILPDIWSVVFYRSFPLFRDIRDYNRICGLKKELSTLYLQKIAINELAHVKVKLLLL
jgi:hypothetical protein